MRRHRWTVRFAWVVLMLSGLRAEEYRLAVAQTSHRIVLISEAGRNLVLVEEKGDHAEIIRVERIQQARSMHSPFISEDGKRFGAVARVGIPLRQCFYLFTEGSQEAEVFASFGDMDQGRFRFSIVDDGKTVLAPGSFGVVCWKKSKDEWHEAWAFDYWKERDELGELVLGRADYLPSFDTFVPSTADFVLVKWDGIVLGVTSSRLAVLNLSDGKERSRLENSEPTWKRFVPIVSRHDLKLGNDGWLRSTDGEGKAMWALDCNSTLKDEHPSKSYVQTTVLVQASRPPTTSRIVPKGENLMRNGSATVTLSGAKVQINSEALTNGKFDDVDTPWFASNETGARVFAEIEFKEPTDVHSLTIYENNNRPESWPSEAFVQVWDDTTKKWTMAARGFFLIGPINTYALNLKGIKKMRYVPWDADRRNLYTCEIEVR